VNADVPQQAEVTLLLSIGRQRMQKRNVQQQNLATEEAIRHHARYWRSVALPAALVEAASAHEALHPACPTIKVEAAI
jgi:hypothetical protein